MGSLHGFTFKKDLSQMKGLFFFESVGVPGGSPELEKGNSGWVPSQVVLILYIYIYIYIYIY